MNTTKAIFTGCEVFAIAAPALYQYNYGQVLQIEGLELPTAYQVEFSNSAERGETVAAIGDEGGVEIPNELLQSGTNIYAFIFLHNAETDGETEYKITIYVTPRPSRPDDTPTPEQETAIDAAIAALNSAVERTDASAEAAAGSASSAAQSAADAGTAAETAQSAAQGAQASAAAAAASETNAGNSAEAAAGAASTAQAAAATAGQAATGAAQSAASAAEDAGAAEQSAGDAATAKTAAQASAASAAASAQSAAVAAQTASDAVAAVQQSAESAQTSATAAAGSASSAAGSATAAAQSAAAAAASEAEAQRIEAELEEYAQLQQEIDDLGNALDTKVDKAPGKDLSSNDYTTAEKTKLDGIEAGAQVNQDLSGYETHAEAAPYKSAVEAITDVILAEAEWVAGSAYYTDDSPIRTAPRHNTNTAAFQCAEMECSPGDVFKIEATGGAIAHVVCFIDENREKLVDYGNRTFYGRLTAPENAAGIIVNDKSGMGVFQKVVGNGQYEFAHADLLSQRGNNMLTFGIFVPGYLGNTGGINNSDTVQTSGYIRINHNAYRLRMRVPKSAAASETNKVWHCAGCYDEISQWLNRTTPVIQADYEDDDYYYVDHLYTFDLEVAYVRLSIKTYDAETYSFEPVAAPFMPDTDAEVRELKSSIGQDVTVTGTTPVIAAVANNRYKCGEVATLTVTPPASGIVDVIFTSGTTPTVLTITPPTGQTVKWANGFDPDNLEAETTYEINIADGLGVAASWT